MNKEISVYPEKFTGGGLYLSNLTNLTWITPPMALKVADYAYIISKGMIVHRSTIEELIGNEEIRVKYLCATE